MSGFWRSLPGAIVIIVIFTLLVAASGLGIQVYRVTHPPREKAEAFDLGAMLGRLEEVSFRSTDGLKLSGWIMPGKPSMPAILLCHDLGSSKGEMVNLAIQLQESGFTLLAFDFRGHGASAGDGSTLGIIEKRDVIGAVDFLASRKDLDTRRVGVYGAGLGAHAAVLAAADRPSLKVLVLDGLYPDVSYPLVRRAYEGWEFGTDHLECLPRLAFDLMNRTRTKTESAASALPHLVGRDLLLIAPAADAALAIEMEKLYQSVPERRDAETNLITLPATRTSHLYGDEAARYNKRIVGFFEDRLARR